MSDNTQHHADMRTSPLDPALWWGDGDYELRERAYAPIHERLIDRLDPQPGERVLDAAELSRVCRGRLGVTAWIGQPGRDLWHGRSSTFTASRLWSSETGATRLLPTFDLATEEGVWWLQGHSGEAIWCWVVRTSPLVRARLRQMSAAQVSDTRAAWITRYENFRINNTIRIPHMYLLTTGIK
jgi:hypothetical protein